MRKIHILLIFILPVFVTIIYGQDSLQNYSWHQIKAEGEVTGRHENGFVEYKGLFYLIGGRGVKPVNVFNPETNIWVAKNNSPFEIHHFQPVVYKNAIYLLGAMTGPYPKEKPIENIWIYYPESDKWEKGPEIPVEYQRGGAGAVLRNDCIYLIGGIEYGHTSGTNNRFDCYNIKENKWTSLTKAPHIRDHFSAVLVDDKIYCIGGRNTSVHYPDAFNAFFSATIPYVDVYDFKSGLWYTLKEELPVPTAAGGVIAFDDKIIYMGGEGEQKTAYNQTQCLNTKDGSWSMLNVLSTGRHGSGAIVWKNKIYFAAGSPNQGGGNMNSIEVFDTSNY